MQLRQVTCYSELNSCQVKSAVLWLLFNTMKIVIIMQQCNYCKCVKDLVISCQHCVDSHMTRSKCNSTHIRLTWPTSFCSIYYKWASLVKSIDRKLVTLHLSICSKNCDRDFTFFGDDGSPFSCYSASLLTVTSVLITPCACARGKTIGLYVCRRCPHENRHFGKSRHLSDT